MSDIHSEKQTNGVGIRAWAEREIVGRGVLLDFRAWPMASNIAYEPFKTVFISLQQLKAVAKAQETEIRFGDIFTIRSGCTAAFDKLSKDEAEEYASAVPPNIPGVEQSEGVGLIWENFFAVAGDQPSFQCWLKGDYVLLDYDRKD